MSHTSTDPSVRLRAALAAGTSPDPTADVDTLIARCAVEPDFFVRDMLTWALTRHPRQVTVPLLLAELDSPTPQARSQALHTLSKIGDPSTYRRITDSHLRDDDGEVARTAWRAASGLVPDDPGERADLAARLTCQLGRGDRELRRSLSRAFLEIGDAALPALEAHGGIHARATVLQLEDPELSFDTAEYEAKRGQDPE